VVFNELLRQIQASSEGHFTVLKMETNFTKNKNKNKNLSIENVFDLTIKIFNCTKNNNNNNNNN
jgi:hypothetical protein